MLRKTLAVPAAALMVLTGAAGLVQHSPAHARASAASYSGTIAFTDNVFPDSLPLGGAYGNSTTDAEVAAPLFDGLLGIDNHSQFFPDLATEVPSTTNGGIKVVGGNEVVTVHLKPNLKWSDGSPITPQDFITGIVFDFSPEYNNTLGVDAINTINFSGSDMVITYKGIDAPALFYGLPGVLPFEYFNKKYGTNVPASTMASYDAAKVAAMYASSSYKGSQLQKLVVAWTNEAYNTPGEPTNGPYMLKEWTSDQRITEVPNPYYNALPPDASHPRPAQIQFVIITLSGTAYPLDMTSDTTYNNIDLAEDFRLPDYQTLKKSKYQLVIKPALGYAHLELNEAYAPLADVRVRQALLFAINKTLYISSLYQGLPSSLVGQLSLSSILPSTSPWSNNASLPANPYNPTKAKQLLAAAGYATSLTGPGKHLTITFTAFPSKINLRSAQLLQAFWNQVGIAIKLIYPPASGPNGELSSYQDGGLLYRRKFQIIQFGFSTNVDPDQTLGNIDPKEIPDASHPLGGNFAGINDPTLVNLFLQARHTLDNTQRHNLYNKAQTRFYNQVYWILLYDNPNFSLYKGTIGNFKPNPTQAQNEWNAFQWYRTSGASPQS